MSMDVRRGLEHVTRVHTMKSKHANGDVEDAVFR